MRKQIIETETVRQIRSFYQYLLRQDGEQLGAIWGIHGLGKTTGAKVIAEEYGAIYLSVLPKLTPYQLVSSILLKISDSSPRSLVGAMQALISTLKRDQIGIFLDDAERLAHHNELLETIRTIHDHTEVPIILVGMEGLYSSLQHRSVFCDRIRFFFQAEECTLQDAKTLAELVEVSIDDALIHVMLSHPNVGSNLRRLKRSFSFIEEIAKSNGWQKVGIAEWGDRLFVSEFSLPPTSRVIKMRGAS
jgi:DNA transposition AAA+ family ATPase